jgi:hypothetical protein
LPLNTNSISKIKAKSSSIREICDHACPIPRSMIGKMSPSYVVKSNAFTFFARILLSIDFILALDRERKFLIINEIILISIVKRKSPKLRVRIWLIKSKASWIIYQRSFLLHFNFPIDAFDYLVLETFSIKSTWWGLNWV